MSFIDLIQGSVHTHSKLSHSQKLHYLKAGLKSDAAKLLFSVTISDSNNEVAKKIRKNSTDTLILASSAVHKSKTL